VTALRPGRRVRARAAIAFALMLLRIASMPDRADAHPLHTTFTELRINAAQGLIEARIRLFVDDLALVTGGRSQRAGDLVMGSATAYLRGHVSLRAQRGVLALEDCGVERHGDALIFCLKAADHSGGAALSIRNTLFTERFADQVNVVRVEGARGGLPSTFLLTRGSPEHTLR
jgi:hypothetical protein